MGHFPSDSYTRLAANRDPEEEALGWLVRMTSGDPTDADRRAFEHWHAEADHALCYERARRLWEEIGPVLEEQDVAGWPGAVPDRPAAPAPGVAGPRLRWPGRSWVIAASLLLAFATLTQYVRVWQHDYVSAGTDRLALVDGSHAVIAPDTALDTDFRNGARHVSLARGEAFFDVRHDPAHPFVVSAGNGVVRVLGTAFSVRRADDGAVTVTVIRGRVEVTSGMNRAVLTPDRRVSFDASGFGRVQAVEASLATAWTRGRLIMENRPLAEVLAELDRHRGGRIVLLNDEAGQRRINAVIDLARTDGWLTALASSQGLKFHRLGPLTIIS